jgi:hypothetical protein
MTTEKRRGNFEFRESEKWEYEEYTQKEEIEFWFKITCLTYYFVPFICFEIYLYNVVFVIVRISLCFHFNLFHILTHFLDQNKHDEKAFLFFSPPKKKKNWKWKCEKILMRESQRVKMENFFGENLSFRLTSQRRKKKYTKFPTWTLVHSSNKNRIQQ